MPHCLSGGGQQYRAGLKLLVDLEEGERSKQSTPHPSKLFTNVLQATRLKTETDAPRAEPQQKSKHPSVADSDTSYANSNLRLTKNVTGCGTLEVYLSQPEQNMKYQRDSAAFPGIWAEAAGAPAESQTGDYQPSYREVSRWIGDVAVVTSSLLLPASPGDVAASFRQPGVLSAGKEDRQDRTGVRAKKFWTALLHFQMAGPNAALLFGELDI